MHECCWNNSRAPAPLSKPNGASRTRVRLWDNDNAHAATQHRHSSNSIPCCAAAHDKQIENKGLDSSACLKAKNFPKPNHVKEKQGLKRLFCTLLTEKTSSLVNLVLRQQLRGLQVSLGFGEPAASFFNVFIHDRHPLMNACA